MKRIARWLLPRSLVGRVFALYTVALLCFVGGGLGLFIRHQFALELENTQQRADSLVEVAVPAIADSAVIGDYDTIRRTLERAIHRSDFASAAFIDLNGGVVRAASTEAPEITPPAWLHRRIEQRLYDTNLPITVGGHDYGVLRLSFATDRIAGGLWSRARYALALAMACLIGGLVLLRAPLKYWLGDLGRIQSFEESMRSGAAQPSEMFGEHAPIEFKQTFDVLNRAAASLRAELSARETAMTSLRGVLEGLMPQATSGQAPAPSDDIAAISQLISHLVARLQERGEQLNAIFALSPDGFVSFDPERRVNYVSPAFTRLTGLAEAQVQGLGEAQFARLVGVQCAQGGRPLQDFDALRRREMETEAENEPSQRRAVIELERPAKRVLEIGLRQGRSPGISQLLHLRDVTHETEVDQLKSEFLSTAAHELRTPMASIYGFSELMMTRPLTPERQQDVIATIHRQTTLMISIVNELLDLARIEARRGKDFSLEDLDLRTLASNVMHDFKPPHERPAPLAQLPGEAVTVRVDRSKMAQALGNVLSNAYKYSPQGGPVRLRIVHSQGTVPRVGIEITDEGIGMTPEQLARVSERFYRADTSGSIPGTGLGMSIVKEIVELLGGSLSLASEFGHGTAVTLWLPLAAVGELVAA